MYSNEYGLVNICNLLISQGECDHSLGADFVFEVHAKELIVGEIFVRVYNEQPTFVLENPKGFTIDLLDYLGSQAQVVKLK